MSHADTSNRFNAILRNISHKFLPQDRPDLLKAVLFNVNYLFFTAAFHRVFISTVHFANSFSFAIILLKKCSRINRFYFK